MFSSAAFSLTSQFTAKERDVETGLDYFGARYYSGAQGRFVTPDWSETPQPIPYADLSDPQTLNLYAYVHNNPLSKFDLDGHSEKDKCQDLNPNPLNKVTPDEKTAINQAVVDSNAKRAGFGKLDRGISGNLA